MSDGIIYELDGYEVAFVPWHSDYLDEDFTAVYVTVGGREIMHAGMSKIQPSEKAARDVVDTMLALREVIA